MDLALAQQGRDISNDADIAAQIVSGFAPNGQTRLFEKLNLLDGLLQIAHAARRLCLLHPGVLRRAFANALTAQLG